MTEDDHQRREGFADAMQEFEAMIGCPVCYAESYLKQTEPALGYLSGWRLACMQVIHDYAHTCKEATSDSHSNL